MTAPDVTASAAYRVVLSEVSTLPGNYQKSERSCEVIARCRADQKKNAEQGSHYPQEMQHGRSGEQYRPHQNFRQRQTNRDEDGDDAIQCGMTAVPRNDQRVVRSQPRRRQTERHNAEHQDGGRDGHARHQPAAAGIGG
jgi:hypothetical protein